MITFKNKFTKDMIGKALKIGYVITNQNGVSLRWEGEIWRMLMWILKNYFELSKFMKIKIYPSGLFYGLLWKIDYKIPHEKLTEKQKHLSNQFVQHLKRLDGIR